MSPTLLTEPIVSCIKHIQISLIAWYTSLDLDGNGARNEMYRYDIFFRNTLNVGFFREKCFHDMFVYLFGFYQIFISPDLDGNRGTTKMCPERPTNVFFREKHQKVPTYLSGPERYKAWGGPETRGAFSRFCCRNKM
jgi:hypothetical protein